MNHKKNHALSIQVSLNGLSFCIKNIEKNTIQLLYSSAFQGKQTPFNVLDFLNKELDRESFKDYEFNEVLVIHRNELSTLVPKPFFDESKTADYLKFNAKILKSDFITFDELPEIEAINVYVPLVNVNNAIIDRYGEFTYKHASTVLLESILNRQEHLDTPVSYIHVHNNSFELMVMQNKSVLFYNSFTFNALEDISYYVLFTFEQLQLNTEKTPLRFIGGVEDDSDIFATLYKYVRDVDVFSVSTKSNLDTSISETDITNNYIVLKSLG